MSAQWQPVTALVEVRRQRAERARQVADVLRHQILAAAFGAGPLPSEAQLCREFTVSRNTVRAALALLVAEGLVERVPGIGTTVVTGKYPHRLHRLTSPSRRVNADPHSAALLDTADRAALLMVERLTHLADGRPVDLEWIRFRGRRLICDEGVLGCISS